MAAEQYHDNAPSFVKLLGRGERLSLVSRYYRGEIKSPLLPTSMIIVTSTGAVSAQVHKLFEHEICIRTGDLEGMIEQCREN